MNASQDAEVGYEIHWNYTLGAFGEALHTKRHTPLICASPRYWRQVCRWSSTRDNLKCREYRFHRCYVYRQKMILSGCYFASICDHRWNGSCRLRGRMKLSEVGASYGIERV